MEPARYRLLGWLGGGCVLSFLVFVASELSRPPGAKPPEAPVASQQGVLLSPPVAFDPDVLDAGKVLQKETVTRTFHLRNRSEMNLRVVALRTACSCTLVYTNMLGAILAPQGEIEVPVRFNSEVRSGPITTTVEVDLRAGTTNYVVVGQLRAEVIPDFSYEPRNVQFEQLRPGERATKTVTFQARALQHLTLASTQTWCGPFEVTIEGLAVTVTFHAPGVTHGQTYSEVVHVHTSSPRVPLVTLSLSGRMVPEVEIRPPLLVFASEDPPGGTSRLTVRALAPCRVIRLVRVGRGGREGLPLVPADELSLSEWSLAHALVVTNALVAGADHLEVEVQLQNRGGSSGARIASVEITRLAQSKQDPRL
ncbi:MAG: hypothetical protein BWX48_00052 [Verrucomicrobia bacterium ADurb.Bin006]|jgi:hypothetical protein|nr:DUF1573 domain-containing protein [Verrucomicrobiota bacterium]OQC68398.1 MAG: hypothetical protein BWX48_00052 [Verrucomicrobia bacterium ADurb.Bin006]